MIISTTTIIAGAVVVLLAVLGSLINPFLRSLRFQKTDTAENQPPVSILITAHDNLAELERNLPMFLRQQYTADYQVIVVCQSTDGETQDFLKRTAAENPHLYYTYIPESSRYMSRKKLQITLGVKAAKHEWIILTEPNCRPSNDKWLQTMVRQCQDPNHLVLGYVALDEETKSVRRFDSIRKAYYVLRRAQQTYGYRSHMPNVASRKSDFMKEQGYQGNLEYVRGEYDFSSTSMPIVAIQLQNWIAMHGSSAKHHRTRTGTMPTSICRLHARVWKGSVPCEPSCSLTISCHISA